MFKDRKVTFYMLYRFLSNFLFFMPVLLSIYYARNVSTEYIFLIECIYYIVIFSFEIPTGWWADRFGHDLSVFIGLLGTFLTYCLFSFSFSLLLIVISQIFLGFFSTFISGSDRASFFRYVEQKSENKEQIFLLQKKAHLLSIVASLSSFVAGGLLFNYDKSGTILLFLTGFFTLFSGIFYFLFSKGLPFKDLEEDAKKEKVKISVFIPQLKAILTPCILSGVIIGLLSNFYWITQMYYDHLNISEQWRGFLFAISSLMTLSLSKLQIFKNQKLVKALFLLFPATYFLIITSSIYIIPIYIIIYSVLRVETQPFIENFILGISKKNKAFSLSISSWIQNLVNVFLMLSFYALFKYFSYSYVMVIQGIFVLVLLLVSYYLNKFSDHKIVNQISVKEI